MIEQNERKMKYLIKILNLIFLKFGSLYCQPKLRPELFLLGFTKPDPLDAANIKAKYKAPAEAFWP
jgi:hypothetical protein